MKPLIAKYLGSLPSINRKETFKDNHMDIRKGQIKNVFAKAQETPMATIMFLYSGSCKYDLRNNVLLSFLDQALDLVYTAEIREKEGGTYGVSCNGSLGKYPKEELALQIVFQTTFLRSLWNNSTKWPKKVRLPNTCRRSENIC